MEMNFDHWSHSKVDTWLTCPMKFRLRYIDQLETLPPDDAGNPLILGTAMHTGIEQGVEAGLRAYFDSFPVISDAQENEAIKLEAMIPKVKAILPGDLQYEVEINCDGFLGYIDGLENRPDGSVALYDFKYSNNIEHYMKSPQLSIYKYWYERMTGRTVSDLYYVMIPKTMIRQKKSEDLYQFRERLIQELETKEPELVHVDYSLDDVKHFVDNVGAIELCEYEDFNCNESRLCDFCEYKELCKKGEKYMILPSTQRRTLTSEGRKKIWIYGAPFSGKTTFVDKAPNPLNLNTDGNIGYVTMPYIPIRDEVKADGRITRRTFAWEIFKDAITELEKKQNDFKTIVVDLLEDTREMCRVYEYDKHNIEHESDAGYGKGWDIIKTEYLSTMRRLFSLDYENIVVISHEVVSEIKKRNGQSITKIAPNLPENIANKIAGMVDIVARVVVDDEGNRTLNFKSNEYIFGGGRLAGIEETEIPLEWDALMAVFERTRAKAVNTTPKTEKAPEQAQNASVEGNWTTNTDHDEVIVEVSAPVKEEKKEEPAPRKRRTRRTRE